MSVRVIQGDVREILPALGADSFECIVTSPPYYGLRDYGTATWEGGDAGCDHVIGEIRTGLGLAKLGERYAGGGHKQSEPKPLTARGECPHCGARRIDAQIGLEPTLDGYLKTMVAVCRELRRVLKPGGIFFLNIGDSYASAHACSRRNVIGNGSPNCETRRPNRLEGALKEKDLMLVPERLGIALQADGWWLRSRIVWAKLNPMPESCTDRPASAHETIWMLTKAVKYFWDAEAVKETVTGNAHPRGNGLTPKSAAPGLGIKANQSFHAATNDLVDSRNLRNVWTFASHPFPQAHFAAFPPELAERCIKAGSSERGCCPACGAPWVRVVDSHRTRDGKLLTGSYHGEATGVGHWRDKTERATIGWRPLCKCRPAAPVPARILDPFAGAGTTGLVADRLGRDCTLIDLNTEYAGMAASRIRGDAPLFTEVAAE